MDGADDKWKRTKGKGSDGDLVRFVQTPQKYRNMESKFSQVLTLMVNLHASSFFQSNRDSIPVKNGTVRHRFKSGKRVGIVKCAPLLAIG